MSRYALVDADGNVVNVIVWDGVADYPPAVEHDAVELSEQAPAEPGGTHQPGSKPEWVPAPDEQG